MVFNDFYPNSDQQKLTLLIVFGRSLLLTRIYSTFHLNKGMFISTTVQPTVNLCTRNVFRTRNTLHFKAPQLHSWCLAINHIVMNYFLNYF